MSRPFSSKLLPLQVRRLELEGPGVAARPHAFLMVTVTRAVFGDLPSGAGTVEKFQLQSDLLKVDIISWGCTITALEVKDRQGRASDVVLGFAELEGGLNSAPGCGVAPDPQPSRTRPRSSCRRPGSRASTRARHPRHHRECLQPADPLCFHPVL